MPDYRELLAAWRDETAVTETQAERIRSRAPRPERSTSVVVVGLAAGLAAAGALLALRGSPAPVSGPLVTGELTQNVQLQVDGEGQAGGTSRSLSLHWAVGTLDVEVTPDQGVQLQVQTDEATVEVVGTGFRVSRDALGTAVSVRHGRVRTTGQGESARLLGPGESWTCAPATAAGRLGRLRRLQEQGAPAEALLDEVGRALAAPDATGAVGAELLSVKLDALVALDRREEALALAEQLVALGGPRALDHRRVAARLHLARPGRPDCAAALPHLRALAEAGRLDDDAAWLTICSTENTP